MDLRRSVSRISETASFLTLPSSTAVTKHSQKDVFRVGHPCVSSKALQCHAQLIVHHRRADPAVALSAQTVRPRCRCMLLCLPQSAQTVARYTAASVVSSNWLCLWQWRQCPEGDRLADPRHGPKEIKMPGCSRYQLPVQVERQPDSPQLWRKQLQGNGWPGLSRAIHRCLSAVPVRQQMTDVDLDHMLVVPFNTGVPSYTQSKERAEKLITEASSSVMDSERQDGLSLSTLAFRCRPRQNSLQAAAAGCGGGGDCVLSEPAGWYVGSHVVCLARR